jgi:hypothetical protein
VLNVADVFDGVAAGAHRELEKQAILISSVDTDLEMASRVQIHREFMSSAVQRAMDAGSRARTLGDYVSNEKMRQVADTCRRTHGSLILLSNVCVCLCQDRGPARALPTNRGEHEVAFRWRDRSEVEPL